MFFYTFKKHGVCEESTPNVPVNRVSRFVLGDDDLARPGTETVIVDNIPSPTGGHQGGGLGFGKNGLLYITTGDGVCDFRGDSGCWWANDSRS